MKRTLIATFAAFAAFAVRAVDVSSVDALTNALANATAGTEIVIAKEGSPYDLSSVCMSRVGHLIANVRITLRGATDDPADVVLQGSTNRILYLAASGNSIRNITFKDGTCTNNVTNYTEDPKEYKRGGAICFSLWHDSTVVSNCVFVGNSAADGGAVANNYNTNRDSEQWGGKCLDCVFTNNVTVSGNGGAAYNVYQMIKCRLVGNRSVGQGAAVCQAHLLEDCDFVENGTYDQNYGTVYNIGTPAASGHVIRNCRFRGNKARGYGAAIGSSPNWSGASAVVDGCLFESNSVYLLDAQGRNTAGGGAIYNMSNVCNCTFIGNSAGFGGAAWLSVLRNCTFIGNYTEPYTSDWNLGGGAMNDSTAYGCTFAENIAQHGAVASKSKLVGCVMSNNSVFGQGQNGRMTMRCSVDSCRVMNVTDGGIIFAEGAHVTNTLVATCTNVYLVGQNVGKEVSMVNCTVVSNYFTAFASAFNNTGDMHIVNSLFFENYRDFSNYSYSTNCVRSITNSVFATPPTAGDHYVPAAALEEGSGNFNYYGTAFDPKFVGAEVDSENPFALSLRSPCVTTYHGQVQEWMTTANDIRGEGFPRLRDGVVDIGCYQCWIRPLGFMMIFR